MTLTITCGLCCWTLQSLIVGWDAVLMQVATQQLQIRKADTDAEASSMKIRSLQADLQVRLLFQAHCCEMSPRCHRAHHMQRWALCGFTLALHLEQLTRPGWLVNPPTVIVSCLTFSGSAQALNGAQTYAGGHSRGREGSSAAAGG